MAPQIMTSHTRLEKCKLNYSEIAFPLTSGRSKLGSTRASGGSGGTGPFSAQLVGASISQTFWREAWQCLSRPRFFQKFSPQLFLHLL